MAYLPEKKRMTLLPKFNWGVSALDANAIQLLNEVPGEVRAALDANEKLIKELKDAKD